MIEVKQASQADYDSIAENCVEETLAKYPPMDISTNTCCFSGWHNDTLLAVLGFQEYWPGLMYLWVVVSKDALAMPVETARAGRRMINFVESEFEVVRLQCTVRADFPKAIELVQHLGFINETPDGMAKYTPDQATAFLYAKIIGNSK